MKCRYSHCKHKTTEIPKGEEVLAGKAAYYHKDCYEEMNTIKEIIDTYVRRVDPHPIMALLRKVINEIVYKHKVNADYLLFALNYCVDHNWSITHPQGLYYVVKDDEAKRQWDKARLAKNREEIKSRLSSVTEAEDINDEESFDYRVKKAVGFGDIIR